MKYVLAAISVLLLCSCAATPSLQMSYGGGGAIATDPTDANDPRLRHREFYLDGAGTPAWMKVAPQNNQ
jgi:hypothetical protein